MVAQRRMRASAGRFVRVLLAAVLCATACGAPQVLAPSGQGSEWHEFTGTWTAAGRRRTLPMGASRHARLLDLRGTLVLSGPTRPAVGFRAEAIVLSDTATGLTGRATWMDENGDQVFSELRAEPGSDGARIDGRIVGGTGRFDGAEGEYSFSWQYVLEAEDGTVQGRSSGLAGRVRRGEGMAPVAGEGRP